MKWAFPAGCLAAWFGLSQGQTLALQFAVLAVAVCVGISVYVLIKLNDVSTTASAADTKADALIKRTEDLDRRLKQRG